MTDLRSYRFVIDAETSAEHFDWQGHLNNTAAVKLLEDARRRYVVDGLGVEYAQRLWDSVTVVVRELHVSYETQGYPSEHFRCGARAVSRTTKSYVVEQQLEEATAGRPVVRAWAVMLLVDKDTDRVVPVPDWYWDRVEEFEGRRLPVGDRKRQPWGPPP